MNCDCAYVARECVHSFSKIRCGGSRLRESRPLQRWRRRIGSRAHRSDGDAGRSGADELRDHREGSPRRSTRSYFTTKKSSQIQKK